MFSSLRVPSDVLRCCPSPPALPLLRAGEIFFAKNLARADVVHSNQSLGSPFAGTPSSISVQRPKTVVEYWKNAVRALELAFDVRTLSRASCRLLDMQTEFRRHFVADIATEGRLDVPKNILSACRCRSVGIVI